MKTFDNVRDIIEGDLPAKLADVIAQIGEMKDSRHLDQTGWITRYRDRRRQRDLAKREDLR